MEDGKRGLLVFVEQSSTYTWTDRFQVVVRWDFENAVADIVQRQCYTTSPMAIY